METEVNTDISLGQLLVFFLEDFISGLCFIDEGWVERLIVCGSCGSRPNAVSLHLHGVRRSAIKRDLSRRSMVGFKSQGVVSSWGVGFIAFVRLCLTPLGRCKWTS